MRTNSISNRKRESITSLWHTLTTLIMFLYIMTLFSLPGDILSPLPDLLTLLSSRMSDFLTLLIASHLEYVWPHLIKTGCDSNLLSLWGLSPRIYIGDPNQTNLCNKTRSLLWNQDDWQHDHSTAAHSAFDNCGYCCNDIPVLAEVLFELKNIRLKETRYWHVVSALDSSPSIHVEPLLPSLPSRNSYTEQRTVTQNLRSIWWPESLHIPEYYRTRVWTAIRMDGWHVEVACDEVLFHHEVFNQTPAPTTKPPYPVGIPLNWPSLLEAGSGLTHGRPQRWT